jgi:hypothetical protein
MRMPKALYRAMKAQPDLKPKTGDTSRSLGVRSEVDIPIDEDNHVQPRTGGMSTVADDPRKLSPHRRPKWLNGTGVDPVFELKPSTLPVALATRQDGTPHHYLLEPTHACRFDVFQCHLWSTRLDWRIITP